MKKPEKIEECKVVLECLALSMAGIGTNKGLRASPVLEYKNESHRNTLKFWNFLVKQDWQSKLSVGLGKVRGVLKVSKRNWKKMTMVKIGRMRVGRRAYETISKNNYNFLIKIIINF